MTLRPDPRLMAAAHLVENLAHRVAAARLHVRAQINAIDGWTEQGDSVKVTATPDNWQPDRLGQRRLELAEALKDLEIDATSIATVAARALQDADRLIGTRTAEAIGIVIPRCNATSRDGAIEWADPTCTNIPTRGPLCDRCSKREYRWRDRHGLPARRDGVFSGDLDQAAR